MDIKIDVESLRSDLLNYYGTATPIFPMAMMDVINVEKASLEELIEIAQKNNIDINDYIIEENNIKRR